MYTINSLWQQNLVDTKTPTCPSDYTTSLYNYVYICGFLFQDPVTQETNWFYPFKRQILKFMLSGSALIFMVSITCTHWLADHCDLYYSIDKLACRHLRKLCIQIHSIFDVSTHTQYGFNWNTLSFWTQYGFN